MMEAQFIVFLKNKTSLKFEYKEDVSDVVRTGNGYRITFTNGRSYNYGADKVRYYPLLSTRLDVRIYEKGKLNRQYDTVDNYGRYLIFRSEDRRSYPVENSSDIEICNIKCDVDKSISIIEYFKQILQKSGGVSFDIPSEETEDRNPNRISSEILLKALEAIDLSDARSLLSNYLDGINPPVNAPQEPLIYPFGCNESQKLAVETALSNSISIVEGPPGTGKTQTILNIVANLIAHNKTVAVVSNNNSAVFNVRDKLMKYGYGMVAASLGNNGNKALFFDNLEEQTVNPDFKISPERVFNAKNEVRDLDAILTQCFQYRNRLAKLKTELSDAETEFSHVKAEQPIDSDIKSALDRKFQRKWSPGKALKFKNLLSNIDTKNRVSLISKFRFVLQYGFFTLKDIDIYRDELHTYANHKFYELYISYIESEIAETEEWLETHDEENGLKNFIGISKEIFNGVLFEKYRGLKKAKYNAGNYRRQFDDFTNRYPVILSSTLSLHTSVPKGYLFDYLIIDESSQVDIIKAAVCFSCCRNAVIVGDSMQLNHIVDGQGKAAAEQIQVAPAYNYVKMNILNSLKSLYGDNIKSILLKEHYRCHPTIIGFCNKKYYSNNLVIMTQGNNHPFKIIETNISGGRDNYNQRQIDETALYIRENYAEECTKVGVVSPYRKHADMLQEQLPQGVEADTIHKFQGREKDVIIFNTVKHQIGDFIDNPNLINVAVSRAVKEFIVVKPESMALPHGTNIGDLVRYICYTTEPSETIIKGQLRSVFDLLYKEYAKVLESFLQSNKNIDGSAAEKITHKVLIEKVLVDPKFSSIDLAREYRLRDLITDFEQFSEDETGFIKRDSRIDFLLYNRIDKTPVLAIEVDGVSFHNTKLRRERDRKKNHVLETIGLPLLRLSTDGHSEESKIVESLKEAMRNNI